MDVIYDSLDIFFSDGGVGFLAEEHTGTRCLNQNGPT